jgi:hypothetical protein
VNLLSERVYINLVKAGIDVPTLLLEGVVLITAFGKRSNKVTKQAVIEFTIREGKFEGVFMGSLQLTNDVIIGCQFLRDYSVNLDFDRVSFTYMMEGRVKEQVFFR